MNKKKNKKKVKNKKNKKITQQKEFLSSTQKLLSLYVFEYAAP